MLVGEIMTAPAHSLPLSSSLESAIQLLARARVSSLPVVDAELRVVGILSEADILRVHLAPDPRAQLRPVVSPDDPWPDTVNEVMTPDPVTVRELADVAELGQLLADTGWKSVPVTRGGRLVGMASRSDILRALTTSDSSICQRLSQEFAAVGFAGWSVSSHEGQVTVSGTHGDSEARLAEVMASTAHGVRRVVVTQDAAAIDPPVVGRAT